MPWAGKRQGLEPVEVNIPLILDPRAVQCQYTEPDRLGKAVLAGWGPAFWGPSVLGAAQLLSAT